MKNRSQEYLLFAGQKMETLFDKKKRVFYILTELFNHITRIFFIEKF